MDFKGFLKNNSDALVQLGAGLLSGRTANEQVAGGLTGFAQARKQNKTLDWLRQKDPEIAAAMESGLLDGSGAAQAYFQKQRDQLKSEKPIIMGSRIIDPNDYHVLADFTGQDGSSQPKFGMQVQTGVDAQGNPVLIQVNDRGEAIQTKMPDGVSLSKQPIKLDAGTHYVLLDPITRQPVGTVPKDIAGAETQKVVGENAGKQLVAAPQSVQTADNTLSLIDQVRRDPGKGVGTGFSSFGNRVPGTEGYDFENRVKQLKSGAFLSAISQMRGLGALSDAEGRAATDALNRLDTATSQEAFDAALNDYETIVRQGKMKAEEILRSQSSPYPQQSGQGGVVNYKDYFSNP